ncbi:hypothetical protein N7495_006036 [Penicillium taxi]|uniref:uncharacterized protein n=1 Tax=Penicillium taxi TaxID=168475 RepID=UPI002544DC8D|nr:uncharacterized protein N7495_006036 [Penicillium taxi]KAJ5894345.1 hypothetical protein N7495_006036 [Penicillium taxi]
MSSKNQLTFQETDEADNLTATYVYSEQDPISTQRGRIGGRVDVVTPGSTSSWSTKPITASLSDVFLPSGYPHSVTEDYMPYQIYDSLQAFSSSIAGLLSSRAVLQGVGVGNANASPTSALLLHILQDSSGRVATILFAHRVGTALEPECKTYRLAADVFNDIAMVLDCLSPMVPAGFMRVTILSTAGILRALCGVAGGSSKASLSAHFAKGGNLAELNAKDSSQETIISLFGMLVGSVVVSRVHSFVLTWASLLTLLAIHLSMNYCAVRAVQMTSLNRQRATIAFATILESDTNLASDLNLHANLSAQPQPQLPPQPQQAQNKSTNKSFKVPTPAQISKLERIFPKPSTMKWNTQVIGTAEIGVSLSTFLRHAHVRACSSRASEVGTLTARIAVPITQLSTLFASESYMLFLFARGKGEWHASILVKRGCGSEGMLKSWMHALLAAKVLSRADIVRDSDGDVSSLVFNAVEHTLEVLNRHTRFADYLAAMSGVGWDVGIAALETRARRRIGRLD